MSTSSSFGLRENTARSLFGEEKKTPTEQSKQPIKNWSKGLPTITLPSSLCTPSSCSSSKEPTKSLFSPSTNETTTTQTTSNIAAQILMPPPSPRSYSFSSEVFRKPKRSSLSEDPTISSQHVRRRSSIDLPTLPNRQNPGWVEVLPANQFFQSENRVGFFNPPPTPIRGGFSAIQPVYRPVRMNGEVIYLEESKKATQRENQGGKPASDIFVVRVYKENGEKETRFIKFPKEQNSIANLEKQYSLLLQNAGKDELSLAFETIFDLENSALIQTQTNKLPRNFLELLARYATEENDLVKAFLQKTVLNPLHHATETTAQAYSCLDIKYDNLGGLNNEDLDALAILEKSKDSSELPKALHQIKDFITTRLAIFDFHFQDECWDSLWSSNIRYLLNEIRNQESKQKYKDWITQELGHVKNEFLTDLAKKVKNTLESNIQRESTRSSSESSKNRIPLPDLLGFDD